MKAFYNEIDPYCCAWISNLMDAGHITPGVICDRSIEDISPKSLLQYDRVHMFAGIAGWDLALQLAGWGNRRVWTGSCPCQPFSAAGKGTGFDDQRHLWPAWFHLIRECRPAVVFGEQVASKDAEPWVDLVHADMEGVGYAFGCVPFPAAGVGAAHIRDRINWVADTIGARLQECKRDSGISGRALGSVTGQAALGNSVRTAIGMANAHGGNACAEREQRGRQHLQRDQDRAVGGLANTDEGQRGRWPFDGCGGGVRAAAGRIEDAGDTARSGGIHGLADPNSSGCGAGFGDVAAAGHGHSPASARGDDRQGHAGPLHGFWRAADWLFCRDGKWRPVEPGTFPLAYGIPARVGQLRAYGNAIVPQASAEFIASYIELQQQLSAAA